MYFFVCKYKIKLCRRSSLTSWIYKWEYVIILNLTKYVKCFLKIFLCFRWKTDYNIGWKRNVRYSLFNLFNLCKIIFFCVLSVHFFQNLVWTCLNRKMKLFTNLVTFRNRVNKFIAQILWVWCHKSDTFNALNIIYHTNKVCKVNICVKVFAVWIYILS